MDRYRVARAMGRDRFQQVVEEDAALLKEYGLTMLSIDSGIRAAVDSEVKGGRVNPWQVMEINDKTWAWLHPLLVRLREAEELVDDRHRLAAK